MTSSFPCSLSSPEVERLDVRSATGSTSSGRDLFKLLVPQIKCDVTDMRESVITALGHINPSAFQ